MSDVTDSSIPNDELVRMAAEIASAYVGRNRLASGQVSDVIRAAHASLLGTQTPGPAGAQRPKPAVSVRRSITPDYLICLEDGKKLKMLKRHLRARYDMTPDDYRNKWGLPADYPMVAPNYSKKRSAFAKQIGLGRKPGARRKKASAKSKKK